MPALHPRIVRRTGLRTHPAVCVCQAVCVASRVMASGSRRTEVPAAEPATALPPVVEPQDLRLADLVAGEEPSDWFFCANELAGPDGLVLSALQEARQKLSAGHATASAVRQIASLICALFSFESYDGPFTQPLLRAAARALGTPERRPHVSRALELLEAELHSPHPTAVPRHRLTDLLWHLVEDVSPTPAAAASSGAPAPVQGAAVAAAAASPAEASSAVKSAAPPADQSPAEAPEHHELKPLASEALLQAIELLRISDGRFLTEIVGAKARAMRLLCQRLAGCAIGPGEMAPPTPADVRMSPAASMPEAATWLLTPFETKEDASEYSAIVGVDGLSVVSALCMFAEALSTVETAAPLPFDPLQTLTKVLAFLLRQRCLAQHPFGRSLGRPLPEGVERAFARAEVSWVYEALARSGWDCSKWLFHAVFYSRPLLPGLVAAVCAVLGAAAGVPSDPSVDEFLRRERIRVIQEQIPLYDEATIACISFMFAPRLPRLPEPTASGHAATTSTAGGSTPSSLTDRFRLHFRVTPAHLANSLRSVLGLPKFQWSRVLGLPLDKGPWASLSSRWPEINTELCRRLPPTVGAADLESTVASMVSQCGFRAFRTSSRRK